MKAVNVNDQTFNEVVLDGEGPVLVDFWAPWCGPCRAMSGVVDEVAGELDGVARVVKANVDETGTAASRFGVQAIPAFAVVKNGEVQEQFTGVVSRERLLQAVKPHLN